MHERVSSFRELMEKPSGTYCVNGVNVRWYADSGIWEPHDIIAILRTISPYIPVQNLYHNLKNDMDEIDSYYNRLVALQEKSNLTQEENSEIIWLKDFFTKAKDSLFNTDGVILKGISLI